MIYYDGTLMNYDPDLAYDEAAEKGAEIRWKRKLTELYYDCCEIIDSDPIMKFAQWDIRTRLNKFFRDELNKTL